MAGLSGAQLAGYSLVAIMSLAIVLGIVIEGVKWLSHMLSSHYEYHFDVITECGSDDADTYSKYHMGIPCRALPWPDISVYMSTMGKQGWEMVDSNIHVGDNRVEHRMYWKRKVR